MNNLIIGKLKEIKELQNVIKLNELHYITKNGKHYDFSGFLLPIIFLRDIHEGFLSKEFVDKEQSKLFCKLIIQERVRHHMKKSFL